MRILRRFALWGLPPLVLALTLVVGFAWWVVFAQAGTRWALQTAVSALDGEVRGIRGTLWRDLSIQQLSLDLPGVRVAGQDLHLQVAWRELMQRRLHVRDLSAGFLDVAVLDDPDQAEDDSTDDEAFQMPELPVSIQVDRLALGGLRFSQGGEAFPVDLQALSSRVTLAGGQAQLAIETLRVAYEDMVLDASGTVHADALAAPWPFDAQLSLQAQVDAADLPTRLVDVTAPGSDDSQPPRLCLRHWLPDSLLDDGQNDGCPWQVELQAQGSLQSLSAQLTAAGQGLDLDAQVTLRPEQPFPLEAAQIRLALPGDTGLDLDWTTGAAVGGVRPVQAQWTLRALPLNAWLPAEVGASRLSVQGQLQAHLDADTAVQDLGLQLDFQEGSRWNGHDLSGHLHLARLAREDGPLFGAPHSLVEDWWQYRLTGLDADLALGPDRVRLQGTLAVQELELDLDAQLPTLAVLWPGLTDGAQAQVKAAGTLADHHVELKAHHEPDAPRPAPGQAPTDVQLVLQGGWQTGRGWQGRLETLRAAHAGLTVHSQSAVPVSVGEDLAWQVGDARVGIALDQTSLVDIHHLQSSGHGAQWRTRGRMDSLVVTPARIEQLQAWLGTAAPEDEADEGGVRTVESTLAKDSRLDLALAWDLAFDEALSGTLSLERQSGDLVVPGDIPIALGLQKTRLDVRLRAVRPGLTQVQAELQLDTAKMGQLQVQFETPLHALPEGGFSVRPQDEKRVHVVAVSEDLAWVNLFLDGSIEIGGTVHADIRARSLPNERWVLQGPISGEALHFLLPDQGVRLLEGTLQARFEGERLLLERLHFPALRRVTPKEWRTATWISEEPDAQDGYLDVRGQWDLREENGNVQVVFHRYPILQRADRYAMVSGDLALDALLPKLTLRGTLTADAGWFDIDMLNNVPSLDGDVIILKAGELAPPPPSSPPLDIEADVRLDLGPRFYLTGYGVNSGLVGQLDVSLHGGKLTALGALRTRGGSIDAYGQHLQLRRGIITFQGDLTNPLLNIEALRTNQMVQAGVRVMGTAREPRIDLVSYPEVSEAEKLSWLLLGRGLDEGGGADVSLLLAVGSSFLADGEPFYRRFGLDELGLRRGELGSTGSILPPQTVVSSGLDSGASALEQQFVIAGKKLSEDVQLSLEQALSDTGTVARLGYRLMRGLQAELTVGTVNGLALVYSWFSRD